VVTVRQKPKKPVNGVYTMTDNQNPLSRQVGGDHYKGFAIQPVEYIHGNGLNFLQGCIVKRITRYNQPTGKGVQDLEKIIHEAQLLIEFAKRRAAE
jgi:hypothetical protein